MKLGPEETELTGAWKLKRVGFFYRLRLVSDPVNQRIEKLLRLHLQKIASGNWAALYLDPDDGRYWEITYPHSEMQGGGPYKLSCLSEVSAKEKYNLL